MIGVTQMYMKAFYMSSLERCVDQNFVFSFKMFVIIYVKIFQTEKYTTSEKTFHVLFTHIPQS